MLSAKVRIAARLAAVIALAGLTAGCFQPMYAEHKDGSPDLRDKLSSVDLPPVDKPNASREARVGVQIRNALAFKLYGNAKGDADVVVARQTIVVADSQLQALQEQLATAQHGYDQGVASITDVDEARSRAALAQSQREAAVADLEPADVEHKPAGSKVSNRTMITCWISGGSQLARSPKI